MIYTYTRSMEYLGAVAVRANSTVYGQLGVGPVMPPPPPRVMSVRLANVCKIRTPVRLIRWRLGYRI